MKTIGVRELKAQLSRVLREVRAGEVVLVTDRGEVVAELRAPDGGTYIASPVDRVFARLASTGAMRVAERAREPYQISPVRASDGLARQLLDEVRADRLTDDPDR